MSNSVNVPVEALHAYGVEALVTTGMTDSDACIVADKLVLADSWGTFTHGNKLLGGYLKRLEAGGTDPNPNQKKSTEPVCDTEDAPQLKRLLDTGSFTKLSGGIGTLDETSFEDHYQLAQNTPACGFARASSRTCHRPDLDDLGGRLGLRVVGRGARRAVPVRRRPMFAGLPLQRVLPELSRTRPLHHDADEEH